MGSVLPTAGRTYSDGWRSIELLSAATDARFKITKSYTWSVDSDEELPDLRSLAQAEADGRCGALGDSVRALRLSETSHTQHGHKFERVTYIAKFECQ